MKQEIILKALKYGKFYKEKQEDCLYKKSETWQNDILKGREKELMRSFQEKKRGRK